MKRLYLIRHAKSSWADPDLDDFERPLNDRGQREAPMMGQRLKQANVQPDGILASPAKRALKTAKMLAAELDFPKERIMTAQSIYDAGVSDLLKVIRQIEDALQRMLFIGHNPGLTDLANYLTNVRLDNLPTCGVFCVDFDVSSWQEIAAGQGIFVFFDYPKNS
jgi:phosphohistidine phosphatase